jgi:EthD domain
MVKVFAFLTRRNGLDTEAFIDHYENKHVPLVLSLAPAPLLYKRNYVVRGDELNREDDTIDFDVVTELVFADRDAY